MMRRRQLNSIDDAITAAAAAAAAHTLLHALSAHATVESRVRDFR